MNKIKLEQKTVNDVINHLSHNPVTVPPDEPIEKVMANTLKEPCTRHIYVVDLKGHLLGSIMMNTMTEYLFPYTALSEKAGEIISKWVPRIGAKVALDIMDKKYLAVKKNTSLGEVARILMRERINELPVVDDKNNLIAEINISEIIAFYLNSSEKEYEEKEQEKCV